MNIAEKKKPSTTREVFVCGECGAEKKTKMEADACCVCKRCRKSLVSKPEYGGWRRDDECDRCRYIGFLRAARANVKRYAQDLANAELHLAKVKGEMAFIEQGMSQAQAQHAYKEELGHKMESSKPSLNLKCDVCGASPRTNACDEEACEPMTGADR